MDELAFVAKSLQTAIELEEEGIKFYSDSASKISDDNGIAILTFLADEEKRHMEFFASLLSSVKSRKALGSIEDKLEELKKPRIFPPALEYERSETVPLDREIIRKAMEIENKSIDFYSECESGIEGEEAREAFYVILNEEKSHLEWLKFLDESLEVHGYWSGLEGHFSLD